MRAKTFAPDGEGRVEVTILKPPSATGLTMVQDDAGKKFARHRDRLEPLDEEAKAALARKPVVVAVVDEEDCRCFGGGTVLAQVLVTAPHTADGTPIIDSEAQRQALETVERHGVKDTHGKPVKAS